MKTPPLTLTKHIYKQQKHKSTLPPAPNEKDPSESPNHVVTLILDVFNDKGPCL
jgi:hypothetical protein